MMELMQKDVKDDGAIGINNPERWEVCPAAIDFLSATTSASSHEELKKVSALRIDLESSSQGSASLFDRSPIVPRRPCVPHLVCPYLRSHVLFLVTLVGGK